ncbi:MAG TPA: hypothetical protein VJR48_02615, partial [Ktedonobacterales bacterium]|nr:hypothetical protein [Ktedonobacterales bacterium]
TAKSNSARFSLLCSLAMLPSIFRYGSGIKSLLTFLLTGNVRRMLHFLLVDACCLHRDGTCD